MFTLPRPSFTLRHLTAVCVLGLSIDCARGDLDQKQVHAEMLGNARAEVDFSQGRYESARVLWQQLSDQGNAQAMVSLARMYQEGTGVTVDVERAFNFLEIAAAQGEPRALYHLSLAFATGNGTRPSQQKADDSLRRAAIAGLPEAQLRFARQALQRGDADTAWRWYTEAAHHNVAAAAAERQRMLQDGYVTATKTSVDVRSVRLLLEEMDGALNARDLTFYFMPVAPDARIAVQLPSETSASRVDLDHYGELWQTTFDTADRFRAHRINTRVVSQPDGYYVDSEIQQYLVGAGFAQQLTLFETLQLETTDRGLRVSGITLVATLPESPLLAP